MEKLIKMSQTEYEGIRDLIIKVQLSNRSVFEISKYLLARENSQRSGQSGKDRREVPRGTWETIVSVDKN